MLLVIGVTLAGYGAAAIVYSISVGRFRLRLGAFLDVSIMCLWQARNDARRRAELTRLDCRTPIH